MNKKKTLAIFLCLLIGYLATESTSLQSDLFGRTIMGGPMVALLVSMILCNIMPSVDKDFKAGTTYCSKQFLNWGIILKGLKPIALGGITWACVAISSYLFAFVFAGYIG